MAPASDTIRLKFPLWEFLNQPLFDPSQAFIWHPRKFWHYYNQQLLERCWYRTCQSEGQQLS
ncbi:MAG: hypothetical protein NZ772_04130 [Cyanobacteria bacterium]|nr:hypothetical protein [Cyanobacteriota bacterium]MDW8200590.1 hypothetical protein [Cyanobacteriota bacterium SKYGB_h_bin112]